MKNLKKITSVAVMLVMMLALAVPALAATNVTIEIDKPEGSTENGETYTVYKIFDATVNGEATVKNPGETDVTKPHPSEGSPTGEVSAFTNVSYTIHEDNVFYNTILNYKNADNETVFDLSKTVNGTKTHVVQMDHNFDAADLADKLLLVEGKEANQVFSAKNQTITVDNAGYYLITSSLGSKAVVDTVGKESMKIKTKNSLPTLTKAVTHIDDKTAGVNDGVHATASYGGTVEFTITVHIPASANKQIIVHDTMDSKLLNPTLNAEKTTNGAVDMKTSDLADTCTMEFVISETYVNENPDTDVVIVYTAKVAGDAPIGTSMHNTAHLQYSEYTTKDVDVDVTTYAFDLVKTNSENDLLPGAIFQLYTDEAKENAIKFTVNADKTVYTVDPTGTVTNIEVTGGKVRINGLSGVKHYLAETEAPDGYNAIDDAQVVELASKADTTATVEAGKWVSGGYKVVNLTGAELPSTGGIGTTIFYVVGGLLVVGAGVMLVTKKRVSDQEQ